MLSLLSLAVLAILSTSLTNLNSCRGDMKWIDPGRHSLIIWEQMCLTVWQIQGNCSHIHCLQQQYLTYQPVLWYDYYRNSLNFLRMSDYFSFQASRRGSRSRRSLACYYSLSLYSDQKESYFYLTPPFLRGEKQFSRYSFMEDMKKVLNFYWLAKMLTFSYSMLSGSDEGYSYCLGVYRPKGYEVSDYLVSFFTLPAVFRSFLSSPSSFFSSFFGGLLNFSSGFSLYILHLPTMLKDFSSSQMPISTSCSTSPLMAGCLNSGVLALQNSAYSLKNMANWKMILQRSSSLGQQCDLQASMALLYSKTGSYCSRCSSLTQHWQRRSLLRGVQRRAKFQTREMASLSSLQDSQRKSWQTTSQSSRRWPASVRMAWAIDCRQVLSFSPTGSTSSLISSLAARLQIRKQPSAQTMSKEKFLRKSPHFYSEMPTIPCIHLARSPFLVKVRMYNTDLTSSALQPLAATAEMYSPTTVEIGEEEGVKLGLLLTILSTSCRWQRESLEDCCAQMRAFSYIFVRMRVLLSWARWCLSSVALGMAWSGNSLADSINFILWGMS